MYNVEARALRLTGFRPREKLPSESMTPQFFLESPSFRIDPHKSSA